MTVNTNVSTASYTGNGSTTSFSIPFYFLVDSDVSVLHKTAAGVTAPWVLNSDYTLSGAGVEAGGTITPTVVLPQDDVIYIARDVDVVQQTEYPVNSSFPASSHEKALDRLTMIAQQQQTDLALTLKRDPLGTTYDLAGDTLVNSADAVDAGDVPNLAQVQTLITGVATGIIPSLIATFSALAASAGATLIGFVQAGVGAIARTVQDKLRERVSVKDFGAKGDGVTDDTTAIQAALDYCASVATVSSLGIELFFPAGQYKTSAQLNVTAAFLLKGAAVGATKFKTVNNYVFNCTASSAQFKDLFFLGPSGAASNGIKLDGANNAIVERCTFQNQTTGIFLNSAYAVEIIGCVFDVCYTYGIFGNTSAHNLMVERCGFFTCGILNTGQALRLTVGSDNVGIKDNDFESCNVNIQLTDCRSVEITGNYMEYAYSEHMFFSGTNYGVIVEGNWISLGDATGGGTTLNFANIIGGRFRHNTCFNQSVSFDTTAIGFTVGLNAKTGTGTIGDAWVAPTLVNSWAQQANYTTVGYTKDENGFVYLRGALVTGTAPSTLFTLPTGFRPAKIGVYATYSASGSCKCTVNPDGTVVATLAASNNMSIDGVRFYVGP